MKGINIKNSIIQKSKILHWEEGWHYYVLLLICAHWLLFDVIPLYAICMHWPLYWQWYYHLLWCGGKWWRAGGMHTPAGRTWPAACHTASLVFIYHSLKNIPKKAKAQSFFFFSLFAGLPVTAAECGSRAAAAAADGSSRAAAAAAAAAVDGSSAGWQDCGRGRRRDDDTPTEEAGWHLPLEGGNWPLVWGGNGRPFGGGGWGICLLFLYFAFGLVA